MHGGYNAAVGEPFDNCMGGITSTTFFNRYPDFETTNDLSLAVFIKYGEFKILFPGDLEEAGWQALLRREDFRKELGGLTVLVASHHGRENGYCEEVFYYCKPMAVVMSDKAIVHDTQGMTQTYRQRVIANYPNGVFVDTTQKQRHVLTTRRDGWIQFQVNDQGRFNITTEYKG